MSQPEVSIVIPTLSVLSDRCLSCLVSIRDTLHVPHEVIVLDNGASPRGVSAPTNAAMRSVSAPYVVFCSDDVVLLEGWWTPLKSALDHGFMVVFPQTQEGFMRYDFAAWCFAFKREHLEHLSARPGEFFDPDMRVWYQDTDLYNRLVRSGQPPTCVTSSHILHGLSQTIEDPANKEWCDARIKEDERVFRERWP